MTQHEFLDKAYREWRANNYRGAVPVDINHWTWKDRILAFAIGGLLVSLLCAFGFLWWVALVG